MPKISICVTVYNLEKYITECLNSVLEQDYDDFEVVVVDNGSSDKSIEICESYVKKYPNKMRFFKLPPPTIFGRAAYIAFSQAKGDYVHTVDGDDYVAPGYLKNIATIIDSIKPDLIIGSFVGVADDGIPVFNDVKIDEKKINDVSYKEAINYLFSLPYFNKCMWRFVIRKYFLPTSEDATSYSDLAFVGDTLATTDFLMLASSIYYYSGPFYFYRRRVGSVTSFRDSKTASEYFHLTLQIQQKVRTYSKSEFRDNYVQLTLPNIIWYFKLFLADYDLITYKELLNIEKLIKKYKNEFLYLTTYKLECFNKLIDFVNQYGGYQGLILYCEYERSRLTYELKDVQHKNIYIFPTGRFGEGTARLLTEKGLNVIGFLDNDKSKSKLKFLERKCYLPGYLSHLTPEEKANSAVVIATIYEKLFPTLKNQLIEAGINENDIFIRE